MINQWLSWQMKWSINRPNVEIPNVPKLGNMMWVAYTVGDTRYGLTCHAIVSRQKSIRNAKKKKTMQADQGPAVGLELSRVPRSCREGSLLCSHLDDVMDSHARKHQSNYHTALMIVLTWWKTSPGQGAKDECVNDMFISNKMLLIVISDRTKEFISVSDDYTMRFIHNWFVLPIRAWNGKTEPGLNRSRRYIVSAVSI